ncbi:unnamed protein product [Adineta steineri]|uniref:Uncharacterized protein n=1 Tax=Adineta steineri TaxID=433720 RepID=A0A818PUF6_9BILA|nr:unnamed protein product [Adineta steineri]CAF3629568.1 unnamed protein product [Adineta steineri]
MYLLITLLLVTFVSCQQDICSCSCCVGQFCDPVFIGSSDIQTCTKESCSSYCRSLNSQCQIDYPNGQILATCSPINTPLYKCQCNCCNTGSALCAPAFIGYSTAFVCQISSCSLSCLDQYPDRCISNERGQTNGTCIGEIITSTTSTTTTTTTIATASWIGNTCSCMCCQSGPSCSPNVYVGPVLAAQCSPIACTQECQNKYPSSCPSISYLGQTNGTCTNQNNGNTRCKCQCCDTTGCQSSETSTNEDCTTCYSLCRQSLVCGNTNNVTESCVNNTTKKMIPYSILLTVFISIIAVAFFPVAQ